MNVCGTLYVVVECESNLPFIESEESMKKFKCVVERTEEYIIEIDENVINEEWMKHFKKYFYDLDTLEEHAEYIAQYRARFESDFIEGYGVPLVNGENPLYSRDESSLEPAINIKIVSEGQDCCVDVEEIK